MQAELGSSLPVGWSEPSLLPEESGEEPHSGSAATGLIDFSVPAKGFKANKANKASRGQSCGEFQPGVLEVAGWGWGC